MEDFPGDLAARYRPTRALGAGGFGRVVLAADTELGRPVAIKFLTLARTPELDARFEREARVTAALAHPNVVRVFAHGFAAGGIPYIVYEYVAGRSLASVVADEGPPDPARASAWGLQLADALAHAHAAEVIHRDVKPGNVLVRDADAAAVLCDFGVARISHSGTCQTAEGVLLGSPSFIAPEVWGGVPTGPAGDQFAWGATMYAVLDGGSVYGSRVPAQILECLEHYAPPSFPPGTPALLARAMRRALQRDPAQRFPDMPALLAVLRGEEMAPEVTEPVESLPADPASTQVVEVEAEPSPAPAASALPARRRGSRGRTPFVLGALALAGAGAALVGAYRPAPPPAPPPPVAATRAPGPAPWPALVAARDELLAALPPAGGGAGWRPWPTSMGPFTWEAGLLEPRTPLKWARFLDALAAWLEALPPAGPGDDPTPARRADLLLGFLGQFLRLYPAFLDGLVTEGSFGYTASDMARLTDLGDEAALAVEASTRRFLDRVAASGSRRVAGHLFRIRILRSLAPHEVPAAAAALLAAPLSRDPAAWDGLVVDALLTLYADDEVDVARRCEFTARVAEAVAARLGRLEDAGRRELACALAVARRVFELRRVASCGDGLDAAAYRGLARDERDCPLEVRVEDGRVLPPVSPDEEALELVELRVGRTLEHLRREVRELARAPR